LGLGLFGEFETISSPTAQSGFRTGEELALGGVYLGASANLTYSCALSLSDLGATITSPMRKLLQAIVPHSGASTPTNQRNADDFVKQLNDENPLLGNALVTLILHCKP
jgi:hypothetical protein